MFVTLLDVLSFLTILYLVTQIFIPWAFPRKFEVNWFFKKSKTTTEKVDALKASLMTFDKRVEETVEEARAKAAKAQNDVDEAEKLKGDTKS